MMQTQFADLLPRWDEHIKILQLAMNSAYVARTGMTPLFFFFGRHPRMPATMHLPHSSVDCRSLEFVTSFHNRIQQARDMGRAGQMRLIRCMDKRRDPSVHFVVGGKAWLRTSICPIPGDKHFQLPWSGPFPITVVTASTATLDLPEHWRMATTFHFDKLAPHQPRPPSMGPSVDPPPPVILPDGSSWLEADRVVKHAWRGRKDRLGRRQLYYLVKYKGFSDAYSRWHPSAQLLEHGAEHLIDDYHQLYNLPRPPSGDSGRGGVGGVGRVGGGV